jgi:hypothetical protein
MKENEQVSRANEGFTSTALIESWNDKGGWGSKWNIDYALGLNDNATTRVKG